MSTRRIRWSATVAGVHSVRLIVLAMAVVPALGAVQNAAPHSVTMQELTVPAGRLPAGCGLKPVEPARQDVNPVTGRVTITGPGAGQPSAVMTNPWVGTDRQVVAFIHQRIAWRGAQDLTPTIDGDVLAFTIGNLRLADGVVEGYAAIYAQSTARDILVHALRLAVIPERLVDLPTARDKPKAQNVVRVEIGDVEAVLYGDGGPCSKAIGSYLASLGR